MQHFGFYFRYLVAFALALSFSAHTRASERESGWSFQPDISQTSFPVSLSTSVVDQIPSRFIATPGTYHGRLFIPENQPADLSLFIPVLADVAGLEIDGQLMPLSTDNFTSVGPILPIPRSLSPGFHRLDIRIRGPLTDFSGLWRGEPVVGPLNELIVQRDRQYALQRELPLAEAGVLLLLAFFFCLIHVSVKESLPRYKSFAFATASWALFYLFLSGLPRQIDFRLASQLHYTVRVLAAYGMLRLLSLQFCTPLPRMKLFNTAFMVIGTTVLICGLANAPVAQKFVVLAILPLEFVPILFMRWSQSGWIKRLTFIFAVVALCGHFLDAICLMGRFMGLTSPFPFLERYTTIGVLLMSFGDFILESSKALYTNRMNEAVRERNTQIGHDLSGPLSALTIALDAFVEVSGEKRKAAGEALGRIKRIASELLRSGSPTTERRREQSTLDEGWAASQSVIDEKRAQQPAAPIVRFESRCHISDGDASVPVSTTTLQRILSNVIDNAIQALPTGGYVLISYEASIRFLTVRITDNGKGIPPDVLPKLMQKGATFGKAQGNGLGLYHAKTTLEECGGGIHIESQAGAGTTVVLMLPISSDGATK